jgi:hypothetical protein
LIKYKLFTILLAIKTFFCSCDKDVVYDYKDLSNKVISFKKKGKLDKIIDESSGLAHAQENTYYTHNDGPDNHLYEIDGKGNLLNTVELKNLSLKDFEEMAEDQNYYYIGDMGNNSNHRNDLRIYKVSKTDFNKIDTIFFKYPDQKEFPPSKDKKNFDCEAFIAYNDSLFLFSKNRGYKLVKEYALPTTKGKYVATIVDSLYLTSQITGADVSPDKNKLALLAYGKIYIFGLKNGLRLHNPNICVKIPEFGQVEAILFKDNNTLMITNEGGKIFIGKIKDKKR